MRERARRSSPVRDLDGEVVGLDGTSYVLELRLGSRVHHAAWHQVSRLRESGTRRDCPDAFGGVPRG